MSVTMDGINRLRKAMGRIANDYDHYNALRGIGAQVVFGNVITTYPDLKVVPEGLNIGNDEYITLNENEGDLIIPTTLRLTIGDRIAMLPCDAGRRWLIIGIVRFKNILPTNKARLGFDGDFKGGSFVGIEVNVPYDTTGELPNQAEIKLFGQKLGFFGSAAVAKAAAFIQTFSTAIRTVNATQTGAAITGIASSSAGTSLAEPSGTYQQGEHQQNYRRIQDRLNELRLDLDNARQVINALIDDAQAYGLVQ
jgi:hypothetical protein